MKLEQNIIKYRDKAEIDSYLEGNKFTAKIVLNQQFKQLLGIKKQQEDTDRSLMIEDQTLKRL